MSPTNPVRSGSAELFAALIALNAVTLSVALLARLIHPGAYLWLSLLLVGLAFAALSARRLWRGYHLSQQTSHAQITLCWPATAPTAAVDALQRDLLALDYYSLGQVRLSIPGEKPLLLAVMLSRDGRTLTTITHDRDGHPLFLRLVTRFEDGALIETGRPNSAIVRQPSWRMSGLDGPVPAVHNHHQDQVSELAARHGLVQPFMGLDDFIDWQTHYLRGRGAELTRRAFFHLFRVLLLLVNVPLAVTSVLYLLFHPDRDAHLVLFTAVMFLLGIISLIFLQALLRFDLSGPEETQQQM